jgi:hypothetical protein
MKVFNFLFVAVILFFAACSGTEKKDNEVSLGEESGVVIKGFDLSKLTGIEVTGDLVEGKAWKDNNGDNVLILSGGTMEVFEEEGPPSVFVTLYIRHYVNDGSGFSLKTEVIDTENDCDFENRAAISKKSVSVTDLDNNGFAEFAVLYRLGCSSELSPDQLRLFMSENGRKYKIAGDTMVDFGEFNDGGNTYVDDTFNHADKAFLEHAIQIWNKGQKHGEMFD